MISITHESMTDFVLQGLQVLTLHSPLRPGAVLPESSLSLRHAFGPFGFLHCIFSPFSSKAFCCGETTALAGEH